MRTLEVTHSSVVVGEHVRWMLPVPKNMSRE